MPLLVSVIWYGWPLPSALEVPFGAISAYERSVSAFPLSSDSTGCFSMSVTEPATSYQARTDIGSSFPIFSTDAADPIPEAGKGKFSSGFRELVGDGRVCLRACTAVCSCSGAGQGGLPYLAPANGRRT